MADTTTETPLETNTRLITEVRTLADNLPEAGGGTDVSLGVTGASVGDIVKVKAVDENGVPMEWEAATVDGDKPWTKIIDAEITEATQSFTVTDLNDCTDFMIFWSKLENVASASSGYNIFINDTELCNNTPIPINIAAKGVYGYTIMRYNGMRWFIVRAQGSVSNTNIAAAGNTLLAPYNLLLDAGKAQKIQLACPANASYYASSGKLEVYAR